MCAWRVSGVGLANPALGTVRATTSAHGLDISAAVLRPRGLPLYAAATSNPSAEAVERGFLGQDEGIACLCDILCM